MNALSIALLVGAGVILGVAIPWLCVRMLVPSLEASPGAHATNYRGRTVFYGLGTVWLVWAGCAIIGGVVGASAVGAPSTVAVLTLAGPLALVAFALGLVDDAYGTSGARGFRGHLAAVAQGRLTTGGLKLIGISAACLVVALIIGQVAPWGGRIDSDVWGAARGIGMALVAGAAIALTSNFVNLTDLRPGRALKVYSILAVLGVVSTAWLFGSMARGAEMRIGSGQHAVDAAVLLLFALGPVVAVWRLDLSERGMLGDAGANPMGAVAGLLIVSGLPQWGLIAYFAVALGLNLASERISFSKTIERSAVLSRLDALGRSDRALQTADQAHEDSEAGRGS